MAEQTVASDVIDAAQEVVETAVDTAVAVTPPIETKPAPKPKRTARKAPAPKRAPAAKAPAKPARAKAEAAKKAPAKAETAKKAAQPKKQIEKKSRPARAGATRTKGVKTMNKQTRETIDTGLFAADQFKTVFGDVNERAKAAAERSAKVAEELADLTRGNVEAFVASTKIAAKAVETLSQDAAEYSRKSFEDASAALKSFAEVRSPTDFFKLQGDYARAAFDSAVAESARVSETMLKLAGDIAEPMTSRYTVAAERVKTLAA
ncbi:MAG: phasin family protein [Pseudomonadota bacterium]|nr:phasin family protein [Pseudomonadota bacterium]